MRRAIERERVNVPFLARLREAVASAAGTIPAAGAVARKIDDPGAAIEAWKTLDGEVREA